MDVLSWHRSYRSTWLSTKTCDANSVRAVLDQHGDAQMLDVD